MTYLGKIGELSLKGSNIKEFEKLLLKNVRSSLKNHKCTVSLKGGRLYIECEEDESFFVEKSLRTLIGITGWAKTRTCGKSIEEIKQAIKETASIQVKAKRLQMELKQAIKEEAVLCAQKGAKTFKINAKRADKSFPFNSYEIACEGAELAYNEKILDVDVHNPDVIISVEVREKVFIYSNAEKACRGLPVGSSGKGLLLLSGGLDSPVAGYRMMRRGMKVECVYFHSYPYTSEEAQKKVETLAKKLSEFGLYTYLNIIPFTDVQMKIKEKAPEDWTTLMLRVCMMKVTNMLVPKVGADCIITGESLGQVASQTIQNMKVTEHFAEYPLLRPLCAMDKEEIIKDAYYIGTYETSILPYEDCCVLFSPKHPVLRGTVEEAEKIYSSLEIDNLIKEAFDKRVIKNFTFGEES